MTEQEFKDYIADEVLLVVKGELMWEFTKIPDTVTKRYTWDARINAAPSGPYNPSQLFFTRSPIGVEMPAGTVVNKVGGGTLTLLKPVFEDSTRMEVTVIQPYTSSQYFYYDKVEIPPYRYQSVRAYNAITNETLIQLGVTDITTVAIKKLKDYGRREAWRHAMWATVGDYDYISQTAGFSRTANHVRSAEMFNFEDINIRNLYSEKSSGIGATSYNAKIRGVWK